MAYGRAIVLRNYLQDRPAAKIFTGTDRHVDFQYTMHIARRHDPATEGIYLDDGLHTYLGARRMHSFQHKYGDALLKKLYYGCWWKNPVILGTSGWISKVDAVFPDLVHPIYRAMGKTVLPFDSQYRSARWASSSSRTSSSKSSWRRAWPVAD